MNNSLLYIAETPPSIALDRVSNLVSLGQPPDVDGSYHKSPTSSKAPNTASRCFRHRDCFVEGIVLGLAIMGRAEALRRHGCTWLSGALPEAVSIPSNLDRQLKDRTCNQNQALTPPVNLVGGAVMRTIPTTSSGLNHPTKGEAMSEDRRIR